MAADLRERDLTDVDLLGADLRDADVRGADLARVAVPHPAAGHRGPRRRHDAAARATGAADALVTSTARLTIANLSG